MTGDAEPDEGCNRADESIDVSPDLQSGMTRRSFIASTAAAAGLVRIQTPAPALAAQADTVQGQGARSTQDWAALRGRIKGDVIAADAPDYFAVRNEMVWNALKPDRAPDVIVRARDHQDVVEAVNFARENRLKVAVRGGGHSWCGLAVRHGGMTIDLSALSDCKIDVAAGTAVIQPAISNRELARRLGEQNLAFPIGHCPTVKASGYLLNGGMSWNMGHWGPACLSVLAIEMVTADGQRITASAAEHPDLFWAARGCGPGMFAVATRFYLKCYLLPKAIIVSSYAFSLGDLKDVADQVVALGRKMPEIVELTIFLIKAPPELAEKCKDSNGKVCMVTAVAFGMTTEESRAALAPLEAGTTMKKALWTRHSAPSSFNELAIAAGESWPENHRTLAENQCSSANPSDMLMALRDKFIEAPSAKSVIAFCLSTGPKNLLRPHPDVALSMDATSYGGSWAIWKHAQDDAANMKWHDEIVAILKPFTSRHYIGETDIVQDPSRVQRSYSAEKWKRLEQIRARYDPQGVFFGFLGGTRQV
jgi:FAD/FMN-containing dehydrogenase